VTETCITELADTRASAKRRFESCVDITMQDVQSVACYWHWVLGWDWVFRFVARLQHRLIGFAV
jgi:hypothetical protein